VGQQKALSYLRKKKRKNGTGKITVQAKRGPKTNVRKLRVLCYSYQGKSRQKKGIMEEVKRGGKKKVPKGVKSLGGEVQGNK